MSFYAAMGGLGAVLYLGAYLGLQVGLIGGRGYLYPAANAVAAGLILLGFAGGFDLSSVAVQCAWIAISVMGLLRFHHLNTRARFTAEEEEVLREALPGLTKINARKILNLGRWERAPAGTVVARQGEPVGEVVYLAKGAAEVTSNDRSVGSCAEGALIGEATALTGHPATATVTLSEPSRLLAIDAAAIRQLAARDGELLVQLERIFGQHVLKKLQVSNERLEQNGGLGRSPRRPSAGNAAASGSPGTDEK